MVPKLTFDARKDYEFALKFFERNFGEGQETDKNAEAAAIEEKPKEHDEEESEENCEGSLVGDDDDLIDDAQKGQAQSSVRTLSAGMKKDRDNYKKKIQVLEKKLMDEEVQNQRIIQSRKGEFVEYGNIIQLLHVESQCYIQATK